MSLKTLKPQKQPLRIAIYAPGASFPAPPSHSVDRVIENLINGLIALNQRVLVFAPACSIVKGQLVPIGLTPILLKDDPDNQKIKEAHDLARNELDRQRNSIDIVHAHSIDIPGVLYSTHLLEGLDIPNLTTVHSEITISDYGYFSNCTNRVIACSKNQMDTCPSMNWFDIVYHGINPEPFPYIETPHNYLCFLGRIDPAKQPHLAIQLAINLKMKIKVAGGIATDEARQYFVSKVEPLLDHPLVEFLGEINFEEKVQLLSHAQCNLHPTSFREPFGLTIIEAGFCGTPTFAIRRGALNEIIKDGKTGVLVDDFVEGCYRFKESLHLDRQSISKYFRERFNHRLMASNYIKAYRRLLEVI